MVNKDTLNTHTHTHSHVDTVTYSFRLSQLRLDDKGRDCASTILPP